MAGSTAILAVRIIGDADDAQKALAQTERAIAEVEATTGKAGKTMRGVWSGVAAAMTACVAASAQLEAATVGLNTIFGDQADEMLDWAEGMAQYGLSTSQAAAAATVLGAQLKNTGLTAEQMTVVTQGLIETSTQLAAVMGGSAVEAAQAMGAALRGEFDSLERYGITLTADAVATEVARLAAEGYTFATEQQGKMVATVSLIQQQATVIMGDAEGQTVTMSTATDHLFASLRNLAAEIGGALTPTLGPLIEGLADTIDKMTGAIGESDLLASASDLLAQVLADVAEILDPLLTAALSLANDLFDKLASFIDTYVSPILDALADVLDRVADALSVVIGWVQDAIRWFDDFTDSVHDAIDALTFWNDTYDPNADNPAPASASVAGLGVAGLSTGSPQITINVAALDPYAAGRHITRILAAYNIAQGRQAGQQLAGAW